MKFKGADLAIRDAVNVVLPRQSRESITLRVSAIPMGMQKDYNLVYPRPLPPVNITIKAGGKQEREENWEDETFLKSFNEWKYLQNIYTFYRVLENDPNVAFINKPVNVATLRLLEEELATAGISDGDIAIILQQSAVISNITDEAISTSKASF